MRIIFSRKGLDSSFGGISSAVMPDGSLYWLPIPDGDENADLLRYRDIDYLGINAADLIKSLAGGKMPLPSHIHLDPDICGCYAERKENWRAAFGQVGAAQSHLEKEGVGAGDIFLFFAWFRSTKETKGGLRYIKGTDRHIINGWLQVGNIVRSGKDNIPDWLSKHPHVTRKMLSAGNTIYIAADSLVIDGHDSGLPAAGYFIKQSHEITLTEEGENRSVWRLPDWFYPADGKKPLSYHKSLGMWNKKAGFTELKTVGRGQEFVLDCEYYPEAYGWIEKLIRSQTGNYHDSRAVIKEKTEITV